MAISLVGGIRRLLRTLFAAMVMFGLALSTAQAAPITLTFEATVIDVFRTPDTTISLDVENGEKVLGSFTFEPFFLPSLDNPLERQDVSVFQPYGASLQIGESGFHTPASPESLMLMAVSNGGNVIFPDGSGTQVDEIEVSGQLTPIDPPGLPGVASSEFRIRFWGPHTLLDSAGVPSSLAVLNDFDFLRNLQIRLVDTSGERVDVTAVVGDLSLVPEPSTLALILLGLSCGQVLIRGRRTSST